MDDRRSTSARSLARVAGIATILFVWGAPVVAGLVAVAATVAGFAFGSTAAGWLFFLLGAVWIYGALEILGGRSPRRPLPPGAELARAEEPRAWHLAEQAAAALGVAPPASILVDVSGGVEARRHDDVLVLIVGMPWLAVTTPGEFLAAVADALARERVGVGTHRMLLLDERLDKASKVVETWPIGAVWAPYVRAGSRMRAWLADRQRSAAEVACSVALGAAAPESHERAAARHAPFAEYWAEEVAPCLVDGFAPPILEGWNALAAAGSNGAGPLEPAAALRALERRILRALYPDTASDLVDLEWAQLADAVWLPRLRAAVAGAGDALPAFSAATLAITVAVGPPDGIAGEQDWPDILAAALTLALVDERGWEVVVPLGGPIEVHRDGHVLRPFVLCHSVQDAAWNDEEWLEFAEDAGIEQLVVGSAERPAIDRVAPWPAQTAGPPMAPRELALAPPPARRRGLAIVAIGVLLGLPSGVAMMLVSTQVDTTGGRIFTIAFGAAVLAACVGWAYARVRVLNGRGSLTVTSDRVLIDSAAFLKEPFSIPRDAVRAVIIDDGDWSETHRFPVGPTDLVIPGRAGGGDSVGWLWTRDNPTVVPLLGVGSETPNVALLVDDPTLAPRVRHVTLTGPIPGEAFTGLLLAVADVDAARSALEPWGVTRAGLSSDARSVGRAFLGLDIPSDASPNVA